jgi:chromosome segregation ATPase
VIEDPRSRVEGAAAAAEAEIASLERDRSDEKKKHAQELEKIRRATADTEEKLEPLQRRLRAVWRRVARLQESMVRLDDRLTRAAARLDGLPAEKRAEAEATIATMRAERQGLDQEEPALAAEIDQLEPAIANLTASLADDRTRAARIEEQERAAVLRVAEKIAAIKARRVVDERAEEELAEAQEESLRALGERLAVERTDELVPRLRGIEEHEVAIGTLERRHLELTELLYGVDRWTVARGVLWHLAVAVAVAAALVWSVALRVL